MNKSIFLAVPDNIWVRVPGFSNYEATRFGQIRSYYRKGRSGINVEPKILKGWTDKKGYLRVQMLRNDGSHKSRFVHRVIIECFFVGPIRPNSQIRHFDDNKADNRYPENLCLGSDQDNKDDARRNGVNARGERINNAKLTSNNVREIRRRLFIGDRQPDIAKDFGVKPCTINFIKSGRTWKHLEGVL